MTTKTKPCSHNIHGIWDYPTLTILQRIRFRIAGFLDNHTQMCWSHLISWALWRDYRFFDGNEDFSSVTCRKEACENGSCYCGKFQRAAGRELDGRTWDEMPGEKNG